MKRDHVKRPRGEREYKSARPKEEREYKAARPKEEL